MRPRRLCLLRRAGPCLFPLHTQTRKLWYRGWWIIALKLGRDPWYVSIARDGARFFKVAEYHRVKRPYEEGGYAEWWPTLGPAVRKAKENIRWRLHSEQERERQAKEWAENPINAIVANWEW